MELSYMRKKASIPRAKRLALVSTFATLYVTLSLLPGVPIIGLPEATIELEASFAPIFGIVLGPYLGFSAALLGTIVAFFLPPVAMAPTGIPFVLCPAADALVVGLIYRGSWKKAFAVVGLMIAAFWLTPPCHPLDLFYSIGIAATWDKMLALLLIAPTAKLAGKLLASTKGQPIFYWALSFIGNQADSALGCLVFAIPLVYEGIFGLPIEAVRWLFIVSPFVYAIIRALQAAIACFVAVPLVRYLRKAGLMA